MATRSAHRSHWSVGTGMYAYCQWSPSILYGPTSFTITPVCPTGNPCSIWHANSQEWQPVHHS